MRPNPHLRSLAILTLFAATSALAHWAMPTDAPVNRLVANLTSYTKEHPEDADGHYALGRVHGLAFTLKTRVVATWERSSNGPVTNIATDDFQYSAADWVRRNPDQAPTRMELASHLTESVRNFQRAIGLDGSQANFHLGLAYVLEKGIILADQADIVPGAANPGAAPASGEWEKQVTALGVPSTRDAAMKKLRDNLAAASPALLRHRQDADAAIRDSVRTLLTEQWREQAIHHYLAAYKLAIKKDLEVSEKPLRGLGTLVGYEAAEGYVRMVKARGANGDDEKKQLAAVEKDLKALKSLPENRVITPIIFPLDHARPLSSLLDAHQIVGFDLDGTGRAQRWSWLRPDTGILVWDPEGRGRIESGRQLFGSVTWWMLFPDGYRALDALDDNRDGILAGDELRGIAVWIDRNANGVSDPGEVSPVSAVGITTISARATSSHDGCPANSLGLTMSDGRMLPTYDWMTSPLPDSESSCAPVPPPAG